MESPEWCPLGCASCVCLFRHHPDLPFAWAHLFTGPFPNTLLKWSALPWFILSSQDQCGSTLHSMSATSNPSEHVLLSLWPNPNPNPSGSLMWVSRGSCQLVILLRDPVDAGLGGLGTWGTLLDSVIFYLRPISHSQIPHLSTGYSWHLGTYFTFITHHHLFFRFLSALPPICVCAPVPLFVSTPMLHLLPN